jgi:polyphosphate kinase
MTECVSPRIFRVVARFPRRASGKSRRCAPSANFRAARGREVVIFDRSWYNRANVVRVMGFCAVATC